MDYLVGTWVMAGVAVVIAIVLKVKLKVPFIKPAEHSFRVPKAK